MATNIEIFKSVAAAVNQTAMSVRIPENDYEGFKNTVQGMTTDQLSGNGLINSFIGAMLNTIGRYYINETSIHSRFGRFYRDAMEFGRFIQIAGVSPAVGMDYVSEMDASSFDQFNPYLGQKPDVKSFFYQLNEKKRYNVHLNYTDFKQAFNDATWGFQTFIMKTIQSAADGRAIDVDNFAKETFNDVINATGSGNYKLAMKPTQKVSVPGFDNLDNATKSMYAIQNIVSFMVGEPSTDYNEADFMCMQRPDNLILFMRFEALNALNTLSLPYTLQANRLVFEPDGLNTSIELFMLKNFGGIYPADSSGTRIYPVYNALGQAAKDESGGIKYVTESGGSTPATFDHFVDPNEKVMAVLCDKDRLMIVNNRLESRQTMNDATLNAVYHLHDWNMFVQNQFRNAVVFTKAD